MGCGERRRVGVVDRRHQRPRQRSGELPGRYERRPRDAARDVDRQQCAGRRGAGRGSVPVQGVPDVGESWAGKRSPHRQRRNGVGDVLVDCRVRLIVDTCRLCLEGRNRRDDADHRREYRCRTQRNRSGSRPGGSSRTGGRPAADSGAHADANADPHARARADARAVANARTVTYTYTHACTDTCTNTRTDANAHSDSAASAMHVHRRAAAGVNRSSRRHRRHHRDGDGQLRVDRGVGCTVADDRERHDRNRDRSCRLRRCTLIRHICAYGDADSRRSARSLHAGRGTAAATASLHLFDCTDVGDHRSR